MSDLSKTMRHGRRGHFLAAAVCAALAASAAARADSIPADAITLLSSGSMLTGTQAPSSIGYAFSVPGPGTLDVTLTGYQWSGELADFSFTAITDSAPAFSLDGPGSGTYDIVGPGNYFGYVTGLPTGPLDLGLYHVTITFDPLQPVPLPASAWLLLAGLAAAAGLFRGRVLLPRTPGDGTGLPALAH